MAQTQKEIRHEKAVALAKNASDRFRVFKYDYEVTVEGDIVCIRVVDGDERDHRWLDRQMAGIGGEKVRETEKERIKETPDFYSSTHQYAVA